MRPSHNLPLPPRIYLPFQQLYATLPESTPPSQNILPFSTNLFVRPSQNLPLPPRIYPPFNNYMWPSQNLPLSSRIYPPFQQMYMCNPPRIHPSLPEYTPLSTTICDPPGIYHSLPEYTPICNSYFIMQRSQDLSLPLSIYPPFNNCMRLSQKLPFLQRIQCIIYVGIL